jgi:hypothetical protein
MVGHIPQMGKPAMFKKFSVKNLMGRDRRILHWITG